jgi:hypothetical protein
MRVEIYDRAIEMKKPTDPTYEISGGRYRRNLLDRK